MTRIVCIIPAYNEAASIGATLEAILNQSRVPDEIVVVPNGCTDTTAEVAWTYPVTTMELPALAHRKSEAMNLAWLKYGQDADIVISHDADTILPPNAVADWEAEFLVDELFGGSTSKFTVQQPGFLGRLQRAEYASNIQKGLNRGWTDVLAGAGTAFSGAVLRLVASREDRVGPWSYDSAVEDYELTYRIRQLGFKSVVSPTVRAYTDGMSTVPALWNQRMKWQTGTIHDLLRFGWNKNTRHMWTVQAVDVLSSFMRLAVMAFFVLAVSAGAWAFSWWVPLIPLIYIAVSVKSAWRIPHRDWKDMVIATTVFPMEFLQYLQSGLILASWGEVIRAKVTRTNRDLWAAQYKAEGV